MQLYILSPLLLFGLYKWGKKAAWAIVGIVVLLSGCLFATQMVNHYSMSIKYVLCYRYAVTLFTPVILQKWWWR